MDGGAQKLLESATHRTLHAQSFSRSSSQASQVLTDLLGRYLALLTNTCAKYAHHAGRTGLTPRDAIGALDELGVSIDELKEYCAGEGSELARYAIHSARRVEDLNEFKAQLSLGSRQDKDDAILLHYARYTPPPFDEEEDEDDRETDVGEQRDQLNDIPPVPKTAMPRPLIPPRPLSPISNPSLSPSRKRARTASWQPPSHIPDFLPPFPPIAPPPPLSANTDDPTPTAPASPQPPSTPQLDLPPTPVDAIKIEKPPTALPVQPLTSSSASDYLVQVPYAQSSLSSVAEWHLPSHPSRFPPSTTPRTYLPTPLTEPALIAAYHHILTHPPPPAHTPATAANPARHKVAMALLAQTQAAPRWDTADTLYSSVGPCPPRAVGVAPTYPVGADGKNHESSSTGAGAGIKFPPTVSRAVVTGERLTGLVSQQGSRIHELARHVLPPTILGRTMRLTHPPVLHRGTKPLTYGSGIPAPWNANALPLDGSGSTFPGGGPGTPLLGSKGKEVNGFGKDKERERDGDKEKDGVGRPLVPDARLYATWDYETKDYRVPLGGSGGGGGGRSSGKGRVGGLGGTGVITLGVGGRGRSGSKIS